MQKNQDLVVPFFKLQQTGENITAQGFIDRFDSNGYGVVNLNQKKQVRAYNFSGFATLTDENLEKQLLEDKNKLLRLNNVYSQKLHEAQKKILQMKICQTCYLLFKIFKKKSLL